MRTRGNSRSRRRRECGYAFGVEGSYSQFKMLSRRQLLGLPLLFAASRARAFGEQARFQFAQVRHGGRWDPRPDGLSRLAWEISRRTSIETTPVVKALGLSDPDLYRFPFAVLSSDGGF